MTLHFELIHFDSLDSTNTRGPDRHERCSRGRELSSPTSRRPDGVDMAAVWRPEKGSGGYFSIDLPSADRPRYLSLDPTHDRCCNYDAAAKEMVVTPTSNGQTTCS